MQGDVLRVPLFSDVLDVDGCAMVDGGWLMGGGTHIARRAVRVEFWRTGDRTCCPASTALPSTVFIDLNCIRVRCSMIPRPTMVMANSTQNCSVSSVSFMYRVVCRVSHVSAHGVAE